MDQNRSTFSTANIGRWQSTFTNGSASHGFKKRKRKKWGRKKRRVTIMKGSCHRKSSNRENKDKKEENLN